ncbi:hypothetical protein GCM10022258_21000 [Aquimarina gracilis]
MLPVTGSSQVLENIDQITPFHEDLAAIRKGDKWAFINTKGDVVIDYREDLVISPATENANYPYFSDGKCLIKQKINGVDYYGYIGATGKITIKPQFLNATNFNNGHAIVLRVAKEELGKNDLLDKKVVSYSYDEMVIDASGNSKTFLLGPTHLIYKKDRLRKPPMIQSHFLAPNLIATKSKNNSWTLYTLQTSTN